MGAAIVTDVRSSLEVEKRVAYPLSLKRKMIGRLTSVNAVSQAQLARETGVRQQNLSRWLDEWRSGLLPTSGRSSHEAPKKTVEDKARIVAQASQFEGAQLVGFLETQGVSFSSFQRWREALEEDERTSIATIKRVRRLERELALRDKALAKAATLLILGRVTNAQFATEETDPQNP
jgi:transposase-like protein